MLYNDFMICCFSFQFYIKPQQFGVPVLTVAGCFSFQFYIKPQHKFGRNAILPVVSHSNSTSNHNTERRRQIEDFVVSHSNSTSNHNTALPLFRQVLVVSHSNSTSNHNRQCVGVRRCAVVSHSNSTSNHNRQRRIPATCPLFLIPILHQTTTKVVYTVGGSMLFLIPILHQTTTANTMYLVVVRLFLIPILHQTTTRKQARCINMSCFSFQFYIKPQPRAWQ